MIDFILLLVGGATFLLILYNLRNDPTAFRIVIIAFIIRFAFLIIDYYHLFPVFGSGSDTEDFHYDAITNQKVLGKSEIYAPTNYSRFLTYLYALTGCSRFFAQYVNVILGILLIVYINKTLHLLRIKKRIRAQVLSIAAFMPNLIIFSAILLREAWIEFLIALSFYYFINWYFHTTQKYSFLLALFFVFIAGCLHYGCFSIIIGYIMCAVLFDRRNKRIVFSLRSIILLFIVLLMFYKFYQFYSIDYDSGFGNTGSDDLLESSMTPTVEAGSAYLTWLNYSNPFHVIIFLPLKVFYFLFSPLPFDWRGIMDIVAFLMDSIIYLFLFYNITKHKINNNYHANLRKFLVACFLCCAVVFSLGTIASGTAMRHRAKICSVILIVYAITISYSKSNGDVFDKNIYTNYKIKEK